MKPETPRRATKAMKSVVVVSNADLPEEYCAGFVCVANTRTSPSATLVIAASEFLRDGMQKFKHIVICFFDGVTSRAQLVSEEGDFCLLRTIHHTGCEEVTWMESTSPPFAPSPAFVLPPASCANTFYLPAFTVVESIQSYLVEDHTTLAAGSENYCLVSCDYKGKTFIEGNKLIGAPVFTMGNGSTLGVVLQDCCPQSEIRVVITAERFQELVKSLICLGENPPKKPRRKQSALSRRKHRKHSTQKREEEGEEPKKTTKAVKRKLRKHKTVKSKTISRK